MGAHRHLHFAPLRRRVYAQFLSVLRCRALRQRRRRRRRGLMRALLLALLLLTAVPLAQEEPLPDFDTFAAQVKKHLATDEERQSGYMFIERRTEQKLDASGRVTSETKKVFEVYPGLPGEERYRRQIEEDGRRTPADRLAK